MGPARFAPKKSLPLDPHLVFYTPGIYAKKDILRLYELSYEQGWELTSLTHELVQSSLKLSREPGSTQQWLPGSDRFNKVQLNKDLMIREPY